VEEKTRSQAKSLLLLFTDHRLAICVLTTEAIAMVVLLSSFFLFYFSDSRHLHGLQTTLQMQHTPDGKTLTM